jgi:hypothetical protein
MSDTPTTQELAVTVPKTESDLTVIGKDAAEMAAGQAALATWVTNKLAQERDDLAEYESNLENAKKRKWKQSGFYRMVLTTRKRIEYYEKMKAAIEEGYVIVPAFPCDILAVRTKRAYPVPHEGTNRWEKRQQTSEILPAGAGDYKSSLPLISQETENVRKKNAANQDVIVAETKYWASDWDDFDFPLKKVKPQILEATGKALELKVFDEIGFVHPRGGYQTRRSIQANQDPMILGLIHFKQGYNVKTTAFLITWWLSAADLEV